MARARKYDLEKYENGLASKLEQNDSRPWFLVAFAPPPEWRDVLLIWPDGVVAHGSHNEGKWNHTLWNLNRDGRTTPPVGWKKTFNGAPDSGYTKREPLPDSFAHGYFLTR